MKLAKHLEPGDRVRMEDGDLRTVDSTARGIASFVITEDGKRKAGVMICWVEDRAFSTVPADQQCVMEDDGAFGDHVTGGGEDEIKP
jgi:hypothetical protein